jgi:N-acetylglucosamine kinase-like BadF-type ATPase
MTRVLGVDGGNTKTLALVADGDGHVLASGRSGCGDIYGAASPEAALDAIAEAASSALDAPIDAAAFSLAGADWPEDFTFLEREVRARLPLPAPVVIVNDSLGALRAGSPDWTGIALVAGTGNAVGARHGDGRTFHLGFWPDGAGGSHLARDGLRAVYRAELGIGPATVLTERALALYDAPDPIAMLHEFTRRGGRPRADRDRFAPVVLDAAEDGDAVAAGIVAAQGKVLGEQGRVCAQRVGLPLDGARVVLAGGVFDHSSDVLADAAMAELPGADAVRRVAPPVVGALLLGFDRLGVDVDIEGGLAPWAASASIT